MQISRPAPYVTRAVTITIGFEDLHGDLAVPPGARALVLFAHGSGSSRHSPRNQYVAHTLAQTRMATLLVDLLTTSEESTDGAGGVLRFDVDMLARRLVKIMEWLQRRPETGALPLGLFGASTGAAAALIAAADRPEHVAAVVSRGGRPDLAGAALARVIAPTLLIVGGRDADVIRMNREAMAHTRCEVALEVVRGATHLFEEPGALEQVAALAANWFTQHVGAASLEQD